MEGYKNKAGIIFRYKKINCNFQGTKALHHFHLYLYFTVMRLRFEIQFRVLHDDCS